MIDLPALYAAVCAKRPELAVPMLTIDVNPPGWSLCGSWCGEHFAAALILARWIEAMPVDVAMNLLECDEWCVSHWIGEDKFTHYGSTPLEALAAYYLGEAT